MKRERVYFLFGLILVSASLICVAAQSTRAQQSSPDAEFGPVVRAYLGYLRSEQEVVDDRASRREISAIYYRRNSNRIRALRQIAVHIARQNNNDYLPEFEAVTRDEFGSLFETPPRPETFHTGELLNNTFRFLGTVRAGEAFYIFARLDPYEQAELLQKAKANATQQPAAVTITTSNTATTHALPVTTTTTTQHGEPASRPRRVIAPQ